MTVFEIIATENGISPEEVRAEIEYLIDATWNSQSSADLRKNLFPAGKPTPEQFISSLANLIR